MKTNIWDEWTSLGVNGAAAEFELAGLLLGLVKLSSRRTFVFKRIISLHKQIHASSELAHLLEVPPSFHGRIKISIPPEMFAALTAPDPKSASKRKGWHWLRGLYGNCGNIYSPRNGYHLSLRINAPTTADTAARLLEVQNIPFSRRILPVGGAHEIMLRKHDSIVSFLNGLGLGNLALEIEDKAIMREMRDRANRLVNCDEANIAKSVRAAGEQVELAKKIRSSSNFEKLPSILRDLVDTRVENPSATLADLGALLSPPVSKSTVRYRWNKLQAQYPRVSFAEIQ